MKIYQEKLNFLLPVAFGITAFFMVVGPLALNPQNLAWIDTGDLAGAYFGWAFYRWGPWLTPLGLSPWAGMEVSSSIIYADSVPLFALIFKPFSILLPDPFQYLGIWYLCCFILQSYFSWKLLNLFIVSNWIKILALSVFVFSPPMMWRLDMHPALAGHFLIIAALYLNLGISKVSVKIFFWNWLLLLSSAILIQFYIFAPVAALWLASLMDSYILEKKLSIKQFVFIVFLTITIIIFIGWQAGYFAIDLSSSSAYGYGNPGQKFNPIALLMPEGWSPIWNPSFNSDPGIDSYMYLGLGSILLAFFGLPKLLLNPCLKKIVDKHIFLVVTIIALSIFSISHHISMGPYSWVVNISPEIEKLANILRASARIFWPAYYLILLASIMGIFIGYSQKKLTILFTIALFLQVIDTSSGWLSIRKRLMEGPSTEYQCKQEIHKKNAWVEPLTDPFWATAGKTYKKVSRNALVLWSEQPENWDYIAAFAAKHRLETNSLYFARGDIKKYEELNKKLLLINQSNNFDKDTLYILNDPEAMMISRNVNLNKHLLSRFNGFWVLAPYWHEYTDDKTLQFIPKIEKDRPLEFGSGKPGALFLGGINQGEYHRFGWSLPEGWGTWSDGNSARLILPIPISPNIDTLSINANIIFGENEQVFEIFQMDRIRGESDSGVKLGRYVFNRPAGKSTSIVKIVIPLTPKMKEEGIVNLKLNFSKPIQPKEIWGGDDSRNLSVGLISATYH